MIFPEGTRSRDGALGEFRHGAFTLAFQHRVPVVPILVDGTLDVLPKHGLTLHNAADIVVEVLDPVAPAPFANAEQLRDHVRAVMLTALERLRRERRGEAVAAQVATG
jgi:1-acyl-sn-glycerol-3-phosphate acyltransferase